LQADITFRAVPGEIAITESTYTLHVAGDGRTSWKGPIGLRVEIESGGQIVHRCMVSLLIRTYADVLVAERPIGRHMAPTADDVRALRMETTALQRPMLENGAELGAMRTRQIVARGSILYADLFEQVPLVQQGDRVMVRVQARGVMLSTEGVAREDGNRGEYITVDIDSRRDRVRARVDGVRSVCVPLVLEKENQ
jgi:flagella basal body P-ring formation protein FlgA